MIKVEPLELNLPTENMCARHIGVCLPFPIIDCCSTLP